MAIQLYLGILLFIVYLIIGFWPFIGLCFALQNPHKRLVTELDHIINWIKPVFLWVFWLPILIWFYIIEEM